MPMNSLKYPSDNLVTVELHKRTELRQKPDLFLDLKHDFVLLRVHNDSSIETPFHCGKEVREDLTQLEKEHQREFSIVSLIFG